MLRRLLIVLVLMLMSPALLVQAQANIPQQVQDALADLNSRLGTSLVLSNLSSWSWEQSNYPDTSLGCPQTGMAYTQQVTNAYHVSLSYNGIAYDYRVSTDRTILILCSPTTVGPSTGGATSQPIPTATAIPAPVGQAYCPGGMGVRLIVGYDARSIATGSVNIRQSPGTTNQIAGLLLPGGTFRVVGGPRCVAAETWWQINYQSSAAMVVGWVMEGDASSNDYWLEPIGGPTPTGVSVQPGTTAINAGTAPNVGQYMRSELNDQIHGAAFVPGTSGDAVVIDVNGALVYYSGSTGRPTEMLGSAGIQYRLVALAPKQGTTVMMATLENDPNNATSAILQIWDVQLGDHPTSSPVYGYQLPFAAISKLAFSQNGILALSSGVVSAGTETPNAVWLWNGKTGQQMNMLAHDDAVVDLAFNPTGSLLATSTSDGVVHLWDMTSATERSVLPGNLASLAALQSLSFSPDGSLLAVGSNDGKVSIWNVADRTQRVPSLLLYTGGPLSTVTFSPDGSVLAVASSSNEPIYLLDSRTGMRYQQLTHTDSVFGLQFTSDGTQLNSVGMSEFVFWRVMSGGGS